MSDFIGKTLKTLTAWSICAVTTHLKNPEKIEKFYKI